MRRLSSKDVSKLVELTGAHTIKRSGLRKNAEELAGLLGCCERVYEDERLNHIRVIAGTGKKMATVLVGASTREVKDERERIARDAAGAVQSAVVTGVVPGGGAIEIAADAFIPEEYVPSEAQKITLYKRIASILYHDEAREILDELEDRFGKPPEPVRRLVEVMRVRALGADAGAESIAAARDGVTVKLETGRLAAKRTRNALKEEFGGRIELSWEDQVCVRFKLREGEEPLAATGHLLKFLSEL